LAQIPNVVQHVQDQMNAVQQQKKAAGDAALNGNTAKAPAGKPAAATALKLHLPRHRPSPPLWRLKIGRPIRGFQALRGNCPTSCSHRHACRENASREDCFL